MTYTHALFATCGNWDLKSMLNGLGLKLEGRHHRGIDDCRNIGRIYLTLLARGGVAQVTSSL